MPYYDFECGKHGVFSIEFSMGDSEGRKNAKCPKCRKKMERVFHCPAAIIKTRLGSSDLKLGKNQTFIDHDGSPIRVNFLDHGSRSGLSEGSLAGRLPGSRIDEKTGRAVVDVVSNVPDPLGRIERNKKRSMQEGWSKVRKKNVNTPVRVRGR